MDADSLTLLREIESIPVIDTHEHLVHCEELLEGRDDILQEYLIHYMSSDLISAGLRTDELEFARDRSKPLLERWTVVESCWEFCRHTGYGRAIDESVRGIYGIDRVDSSTIEELGSRFKLLNKPGHLKRVLKDLCNIELSVIDPWTGRFEYDSELFRRVWQPQNYLIPLPYESDVITWLENTYRITIRTLEDWLNAFEIELNDNLSNGVIGLKSVLAYYRPIRFRRVPREDAARGFREAFKDWEEAGHRGRFNIVLPDYVQDYVMHHILSVANEKGLFFQFHTGLLEGNRGVVSNSNPELLEELFLLYPEISFDLFHISYPYQSIASAMAKTYPNVYIDMCWSHIISPSAARNALNDFLDAVPYNKIMGFGGDYGFVDGIYGHLKIARENIARVLSNKICEGMMSCSEALRIAERLLHDNPVQVLLDRRSG